jgi:hypothetical protein
MQSIEAKSSFNPSMNASNFDDMPIGAKPKNEETKLGQEPRL